MSCTCSYIAVGSMMFSVGRHYEIFGKFKVAVYLQIDNFCHIKIFALMLWSRCDLLVSKKIIEKDEMLGKK